MTPYVSFLLDLAGGQGANGDVRIADGSMRFAPSNGQRPASAFTWKVSVNTQGFITVRGFHDGRYVIVATAEWRDDKFAEHHQRHTSVPTFYQWNLVEQSVRSAIETASVAEPPPYEPEPDDAASGAERRALLRTPPAVLEQSEVMRQAAYQTWVAARSRRRTITGLVTGFVLCGALILAVTLLITWAVRKPDKVPTPSPPVATPDPPSVTELPVSPPTAATAASFAQALALARPAFTAPSSDEISPAASELARYRKLQWSDLAGEPETTLGLLFKDAQAEQGKLICIEGTIERITRRDLSQPGEPPRRAYVGVIRPDGEDPVWFVVTGSTGDLVKRSRARLCGIVTGISNGVPAVYGLFDLLENAQPIVEQ